MGKLKKIIVILAVLAFLLLPLTGAIFLIKKIFPNDVLSIQNQAKSYLAIKLPFLKNYLHVPEKETTKIVEKIEKQNYPEEKILKKLFNQDAYFAVCGEEGKVKPLDEFLGCNHCPNYMEEKNRDYFTLDFYAIGQVLGRNEIEAVLFMNGCTNTYQHHAIVLRKGFGGWRKVDAFRVDPFVSSPLQFQDKDGFVLLLGKREQSSGGYDKETLYSLSFKNGKVKSSDLISTQTKYSVTCSDQFLVKMGKPEMIPGLESEFSLKIDVLGWQHLVDSDCKINSRKLNVRLQPGVYMLHFIQKNNTFVGNKETQKIMTELEKSQE